MGATRPLIMRVIHLNIQASKPRQGGYNPCRDCWTGKTEKYSGSADGSVDNCLELMEERLDGSSMSEKDEFLPIKDHLTGKARKFLLNKSPKDRKRLSRVIKLMSRRF